MTNARFNARLFWLISAMISALVVAGSVAFSATQSAPSSPKVVEEQRKLPARLELVCALKAATEYDVTAGDIQAVRSTRQDATSFRIMLNVKGNATRCFIKEDATHVSLQRIVY